MAMDIKQAQRRLLEEAFGKGNFGVFDEICDPGFRAHDPVTGDADLQQEKENCRLYKAAFPDLQPTILASCAEADTVVTHWRMIGTHQKALMGIAPTNRRCTVEGVSIGKFRGGKLIESWVHWNALGLLQQLGVAPRFQTGATGTQAVEQRPQA